MLLLAALLLPPAALVGLLGMHGVEKRMDDVNSHRGRASASDPSWLATAQARANRLRRRCDTHTRTG